MKYRMKLNIACLVILLGWAGVELQAQAIQSSSFGRGTSLFYGNGLAAKMKEIPYPTESETGRIYLFDEWKQGSLFLKSRQVLLDMDLQYDLENHRMEISLNNDLQTLESQYIREFDVYDHGDTLRFINVNFYQDEDMPQEGFYQLLVPGDMALLQYEKVRIIPLNGGLTELQLQARRKNQTPQVERKSEFYCMDRGEMYKFKPKKKEILSISGTHSKEIEKFVKDNDLSYKEPEDLEKIFELLNSLKK